MILKRDWLAPPVDWVIPTRQHDLSREDIAVFLARGTPRLFRSLFSNVVRLPPGYALKSPLEDAPGPVRTWSASDRGSKYFEYSLDARASALRELLRKSVRQHSEGKRVGLLLSGGYDSTLLATLLAQDGVDLRCYSIEAPEFFPSEWEEARATAKRLGLRHKKITVTLPDLLRSAAQMMPLKNSPNLCLTTAHLLAASQVASEDGCDLMMSGTGSDELFATNAKEIETIWHFERRVREIGQNAAWSMLTGAPSEERTEMLYKGSISPFSQEDVQSLFPDLDIRALVEEDIVDLYRDLHVECPAFPYGNLSLELELQLRSSDVLIHELGTAAQVHGMPLAFPFYDPAVAELAAGTPLAYKLHHDYAEGSYFDQRPAKWTGVVTKYLLRYAFQDLMPEHLDQRPRYASTLPFSWSAKTDVRQQILEIIEGSPIWNRLGISRNSLAKITAGDSSEKQFWSVPRRFWLLQQLSTWQGTLHTTDHHRL